MPNESLEAHITVVLVHLNDLLQKAATVGKRISFADDVVGATDVTDLIRQARNAACHISSHQNLISPGGRFVFNVVRGHAPQAFVIGEMTLGCDHANDMAVYYGSTRVYVRRHLERATREAVAALKPDLMTMNFWPLG